VQAAVQVEFSVLASRGLRYFDKDTNVKINFTTWQGGGSQTEVMEIVDFLKKPEKIYTAGRENTQGRTSRRPPGNGKNTSCKGSGRRS
jgi:ATP-dependent Zn protease